jgi:hypothetical protein
MNFINTRFTGFGTFLPIILKDGFHYSTIQAQYLVVPGKSLMTADDCSCLDLAN